VREFEIEALKQVTERGHPAIVEDYRKANSNTIDVYMGQVRLATALPLARFHGVQFAAAIYVRRRPY